MPPPLTEHELRQIVREETREGAGTRAIYASLEAALQVGFVMVGLVTGLLVGGSDLPAGDVLWLAFVVVVVLGGMGVMVKVARGR